MIADADPVAWGYLQHLTAVDLDLLAATAEHTEGARASTAPTGAVLAARLRNDPGLLDQLLAAPATWSAIFPTGAARGESSPNRSSADFSTPAVLSLAPASPFLTFAVAIARTTQDLSVASYVTEWFGPRRRAPIFDVSALRDFLSLGRRRLFLVELLASYTHVSSGSFRVPTRRGARRQRFSELDPLRLAGLLEVVSDLERPGVYRRLGDLALFLTGVFPDHTALHHLGEHDERHLLRSGRLSSAATATAAVPGFGDPGPVELFERLGRRWYALAYQLVPRPRPDYLAVIAELEQRFGDARRILNVVTDRYLFPLRDQWFGLTSP